MSLKRIPGTSNLLCTVKYMAINNHRTIIPVTAIPAMTMPVYVASVPACLTVSKHILLQCELQRKHYKKSLLYKFNIKYQSTDIICKEIHKDYGITIN